MKVYFDSIIYGTQRYGGISRYSLALSTEVAKVHDVKIVSFISINHYLNEQFPTASLVRLDKKLRYSHRFNEALNFFYLYFYCLVRPPDVLHLTFYSFWFKYFKPRSRKIVLTIYDFIDERVEVSSVTSIRDKVLSMSIADKIICISRNTESDLKFFYPEFFSKSVVIHFGFEKFKDDFWINNLAPNSGLLREEFILFVGQRGRYKNFKLLVEAVKLLENERLKVIAFGPPPSTGELMDYKDCNVQFVSGDDNLLVSLYRRARCFVFPSSYEGFGIPSLEAMALDCPVIVPNSSCFPEIVGDAGLYFEDNDSRSLSKQILKIICDEGLRKELVMKGRMQIERYSYLKCGILTMSNYE